MKTTTHAISQRSPTLLLALFAAPLFGQDAPKAVPKTALETSEERAETPHEQLASALMGYRNQKELVVRATVSEKDPVEKPGEQNVGGGIAGFQVVIRNGAMNGAAAKPFQGELEAWRDSEGDLVILSRKALPGLAIFQSGKRTIQRHTTEGATPETKFLCAELQSIMDGIRLTKHALASKLTPKTNADTGEVVWSGEISKDVVRPVRANGDPRLAMVMEQFAPRVLKANIELRVSNKGKLREIKLSVVRNDPAREMLKGGGLGRIVILGAPGQPGKAGGIGRGLETNADAEKHEIEGKTTVYEVEIETGGASERAKAFKRDMTRLTEDSQLLESQRYEY
jgi:hypothetical protein